jgi:two-component sensor histidine kinase
VQCHGEPIVLRPEAVQNVGLSLHELATNAAKYGALSTPEGRVDITWAFDGSGPDRIVRLTWRESGGPPVRRPTRRGFGSFVLEQVAPSMLGAKGVLQFEASGVVWTCDIAARSIVDQAGAVVGNHRGAGRTPPPSVNAVVELRAS